MKNLTLFLSFLGLFFILTGYCLVTIKHEPHLALQIVVGSLCWLIIGLFYIAKKLHETE